MSDTKRPPRPSAEEFHKRLPPARPDVLLGALHDKVHKDFADSEEYNERTCVTAGELREPGMEIDESVPDCAWTFKAHISIDPESAKTSVAEDGTRRTTFKGYQHIPRPWFNRIG